MNRSSASPITALAGGEDRLRGAIITPQREDFRIWCELLAPPT